MTLILNFSHRHKVPIPELENLNENQYVSLKAILRLLDQ